MRKLTLSELKSSKAISNYTSASIISGSWVACPDSVYKKTSIFLQFYSTVTSSMFSYYKLLANIVVMLITGVDGKNFLF